ncbi:19610_t:CDS:2 [Racocetra persica]|uniref:19610_t:CDS:1 n=1 Tax=Racocetra persica TaxID=160502 RepID=A0ACA9PQX5_9GLOM|nr:19610_t:CDS:2 [Racocetra persica]
MSSKQTNQPYYSVGHEFEIQIEKLLNENGIQARVVSYQQGDNGIDIIATFNRRIILIQCKHVSKPLDVNVIKNFQASVYRFGDSIISAVVYNSEVLKYNPLTRGAVLWLKAVCPEIQIVTEETIVRSRLGQSGLSFKEKPNYTNPTSNKSENDFKRYVERLLNENKVLTNSFDRREDNRRGDKIDFIATYNRQIILINVSRTFDKKILKDFQTSVDQYGEGILGVIVYSSHNPLSKNEGLGSEVKIVTEKMLVNCIKDNLSSDRTRILFYDELFANDENDYNLGQDSSSTSECEMCSNERPDQNTSRQWDCPRCTFTNQGDVIMCEACYYVDNELVL